MTELRNGDIWEDSVGDWHLVVENNNGKQKRVCVIFQNRVAYIFNSEEIISTTNELRYISDIVNNKYKYIGNIHNIKKEVQQRLGKE